MKTQHTKICGIVINQELESYKISVLENMKTPKAMTSGTRKRGDWLTNWLCVSIDSTGKSWRKRQTTLCGRFNKQETSHMRLLLGSCKEQISRLVHQNLESYMEVNWVQSIYHSDGLNNTLLFQGYVLENSSHCGNDGQNVCSKDREVGKEPSIAHV